MSRDQVGMELGLSAGEQDDLQSAFLSLSQRGPGYLGLASFASRVLHLERAAAL